MRFEKKTSVVLICTVLSNDLNLGSPVTAIFRVVVVRNNFDFLDGVFVRCYDRCAAPGDAGGADAVDGVIVFASSGAVCRNLATVLDLKDAVRGTGAANRSGR